MQEKNCQLSAVVATKDGGVEAQLLEFDIAARGATIEDILEELGYAITLSYEIAMDLGQTPFINLPKAPPHFQMRWNDSPAKQVGVIDLPEDVGLALAIALHFREPIHQIPVFERQAA